MNVIKGWKRELENDKFFQSIDANVQLLILLEVARSSVENLKAIRLTSKKYKKFIDDNLPCRYFGLDMSKLFAPYTCGFNDISKAASYFRQLTIKRKYLFSDHSTILQDKNVIVALANDKKHSRGFLRTIVKFQYWKLISPELISVFIHQKINQYYDFRELDMEGLFDDYVPHHVRSLYDCGAWDGIYSPKNMKGSTAFALRCAVGLGLLIPQDILTRNMKTLKRELKDTPISRREWLHIIRMGVETIIRTILSVTYDIDRPQHDQLLKWAEQFETKDQQLKKKRKIK